MAKGITEATIKPALKFPNNKTKTKITIKAPSAKFLVTVLMALFTNLVLSRNGSITIPSGSVFLICAIRSLTFSITLEELAPFNIITTAPTTSPSSFLVMAPYLVAAPILTTATFLIKTGMLFSFVFTTMFSISLMLLIRPSLLIK